MTDELVGMIIREFKMERLTSVPPPVIEEIVSQTLSALQRAEGTRVDDLDSVVECLFCHEWIGGRIKGCDCSTIGLLR